MEYTLRKPKATDIFVVSKIIKGIGLKNIKNCFNSDERSQITTKKMESYSSVIDRKAF